MRPRIFCFSFPYRKQFQLGHLGNLFRKKNLCMVNYIHENEVTGMLTVIGVSKK